MAESKEQGIVTEVIDIHTVLRLFEHHRQALKFSPAPAGPTFSAIILDCDQDKSEFVVHDTTSSSEIFQPGQNTVINFEGVVDGLHYQILDAQWLGYCDAAQLDHRFRLPKSIAYQRRRQTFRTPIPRGINNRAELLINKLSAPLLGRILDLSITGAACEYAREAVHKHNIDINKLSEQQIFLRIEIKDVLTMKCQAMVKAQLPKSSARFLRLGLEFCDLGISSERLVSKAVVDLQRMTRKNQTR